MNDRLRIVLDATQKYNHTKPGDKIKMDNQLVSAVELENTMIKCNARQRLIAKIVQLKNTTINSSTL